MKLRLTLIPILTTLIFGCATPLKDSLTNIRPGMDKDEILDINGNPWITRRVNSRDVWIYRYYEGEQEFHKNLTFENGRVVEVGVARPHPDPQEELLDATNMNEYSRSVEDRQRNYRDGFKKLEDDD